jgi:hypothetical protein
VRIARLLPIAATAAATLAVAACGGSSTGTPPASTAPGSPANPLQGVEQPGGVPSRADAGGHGTARDGAGGAGHAGGAGRADNKHAGARSPEPAAQAQATHGRTNEGATVAPVAPGTPGAAVGYQQLVEQQSRNPQRRFTPCSLVTKAQARAIVGTTIKTPLEAAQGPTCIYRSTPSAGYITVAVQNVSYSTLARGLRGRHRVTVGTRTAVCGSRGRPTVLVALSGGRTLDIAAPCELARQFAVKAVQRLRG